MKHDPIEPLARMAHIYATEEAGEHVPWALLAVEQRSARTNEAAATFSGFGKTCYPIRPEGLTAPRDIASAAEARIGARERGAAAGGEAMARGVPLVMALMRSAPEGTP